MVERILPKLTDKLGDTNLSERTIKEYAMAIAPSIKEESQLDDAFVGFHVGILKTMGGQLAHDTKNGVEQFKKDYKPEIQSSSTQYVQPKTDAKPIDEISQKLKELDEFKKSLENRYESEYKAAKINEKRNGVLTKLKEQGADDPEILEFVELKLSIEADSDVNALVTSATQLYNDKYSRVYKGEVNPASGYGNTTAAKKNVKDAYLKHLEETGRIKPKTQN